MTNPRISAAEIQFASPENTFKAGIGFASPLWPAYAVVAGAGIAYWWMAEFSKRAFRFEGMALLPKPLVVETKAAELTDAVEIAPASASTPAVLPVSEPVQNEAVKSTKAPKVKRAGSETSTEDELAPTRKPTARKAAVRKATVTEH